jgi:hypothetical protein
MDIASEARQLGADSKDEKMDIHEVCYSFLTMTVVTIKKLNIFLWDK